VRLGNRENHIHKTGKMNSTSRFLPLTYGMRLGIKASLVLAGIYWTLGLGAEVVRQMWLTHELRFWMLPIARFPGMLLSFFLFILVIVLLVGLVSGMLIGEIWQHIGIRVDGRVFAVVCLMLCASLVTGIHLIYHVRFDFWIPTVILDDSAWFGDTMGLLLSYPFLLGVPSIIYMVAGAVGSHFFQQAFPSS
jgi:hypothetical protein